MRDTQHAARPQQTLPFNRTTSAVRALSLLVVACLAATGSITVAGAAPPQQLPTQPTQRPQSLGAPVVAAPPACEGGADTCNAGFFWRNAFSGDHVCVTPAVRDQVVAENKADAARVDRSGDRSTANQRLVSRTDNCPAGQVWRLASRTDHVCVTSAAAAQTASDNAAAASRFNPQCKLPPGSYLQSCYQALANGVTLRAQCKNNAGALVATQLDGIASCQGDISNVSGKLRCNKGGAVPAGSYQTSCPYAWTESPTVLGAQCKNFGVNSPLFTAALPNFRQCVGDIFVANNNLHCARGPLPPGPYTPPCNRIWVEGSFLYAACPGGSGGGWQALNISGCNQPIVLDHGTLHCGAAPPPPTVAVPQLVSSTLAQAKADIQAAGFVVRRLDSSCGGQLDTYVLVGSQSPAALTAAAKGSPIDITRCVPPPVTNTATNACAGGATYVTLCATCSSAISGDKKSEFAGYTCLSESDAVSALQQQFGGCAVVAGACSF